MDYEKIGRFICELRTKKGDTQKDLAEHLCVTTQAISKWERGLGCPDVSLLKPISEYFDISVGELLNGEKIDKKNMLEKVDDILMKNLEETREKTRKERILFGVTIISIILVFLIFIMNIYNSFKLILIMIILGIILYTPVILNKKNKLRHLIIPIFAFMFLIICDYISVSVFRYIPILYYNYETVALDDEMYSRYDSFLYRAYRCSINSYITSLDNIKESPDNYCRTYYESNIVKSASIETDDGYIYYLSMTYSDEENYKGSFYYFMESYDLSEFYNLDSVKELTTYSTRVSIHGDNDLSYAPTETKEDINKIINYLSNRKFTKTITVDDLKDLELDYISKSDVVELFNKTIEKDTYNVYVIDKIEEEINDTNYEVVYMYEGEEITHVKINIKTDTDKFDSAILGKIEDDIIDNQTFDIDADLSSAYDDLLKILKKYSYKIDA